MRRWLDVLYKASCWLGAGCIALICLLVVCQVLLNLLDRLSTILTGSRHRSDHSLLRRFYRFSAGCRLFFILAYTLREGAHIRVVLLVSRLPEKMHRLVEIWCIGFGLAVTLYFTWYTAMLTYESYTYHDLSSGMIAVPIWIPQAAMLFGLVISSWRSLMNWWLYVVGHTACYAGKGEELLTAEQVR